MTAQNQNTKINKSSHMRLIPKTPTGVRITEEWGTKWFIHHKHCRRKVSWSTLLVWYRISPANIRSLKHEMCVWIHPRTNEDFDVGFIDE